MVYFATRLLQIILEAYLLYEYGISVTHRLTHNGTCSFLEVFFHVFRLIIMIFRIDLRLLKLLKIMAFCPISENLTFFNLQRLTFESTMGHFSDLNLHVNWYACISICPHYMKMCLQG